MLRAISNLRQHLLFKLPPIYIVMWYHIFSTSSKHSKFLIVTRSHFKFMLLSGQAQIELILCFSRSLDRVWSENDIKVLGIISLSCIPLSGSMPLLLNKRLREWRGIKFARFTQLLTGIISFLPVEEHERVLEPPQVVLCLRLADEPLEVARGHGEDLINWRLIEY